VTEFISKARPIIVHDSVASSA